MDDTMDKMLDLLIKEFFKAYEIVVIKIGNSTDENIITIRNQLKDNIDKLENHVENLENLSILISDEELDNETNEIKSNIIWLFILSLRLIKQVAEEETKGHVMVCNLCIRYIISTPE